MGKGSKEYFDGLGSEWDTLREGFFSENVRETALEVGGVEPGERAADLGAGTGFITEALVNRGLSVVAVDQSEVMLDALRQKFPSAAVDCRPGEAEALPLEDGTVDHAFANMYLHHVERPAAAIREMARILKPGGTLVVTDLDSHDFEFLRTDQHDRWLGFEREAVATWYREAGLVHVTVAGVGEDCSSTSSDGIQAAISIFVASGRKPESV